MKITTSQGLALRKHAGAAFRMLGVKNDDVSVHHLEWKALNALEKDLGRHAGLVVDKIKDDMDEDEARSIAEAVDCLMEIRGAIEGEKNIRSALGDRGARENDHNPKRPMPLSGVEGRGVEDGEDYDEDGNFIGRETRETMPVAFALRSNQTMADHVRRTGRSGSEFRGLTEGAFLRAMVTGAKSAVEKRALAEGSDSNGGYTVPDILSARMIDRMRAASVVFRAGAQTVPLTSDKNTIAKVATDPSPAWRMENEAINESEPSFTQVVLTPRSLAVLVKTSRELLEDSLNIETALPDLIAKTMAAEVDRVALLGTGVAPQPKGVKSFAGLTPNAFAGGALASYSPLLKARTALRTVNSNVTAYIMHPRDEGALSELTDLHGQPLNIPPAIADVPMLTTTTMPTNLGAGHDESFVLAGEWSRLLIGFRSTLRIEVLKERYADFHQFAFIAHLRVDMAAEHEAAFTVLSGVKQAA